MVQQDLLAQQAAGLIDQGQQQVEGTGTECGRLAVHQQQPFMGPQLETATGAEASCGRQGGRGD